MVLPVFIERIIVVSLSPCKESKNKDSHCDHFTEPGEGLSNEEERRVTAGIPDSETDSEKRDDEQTPRSIA